MVGVKKPPCLCMASDLLHPPGCVLGADPPCPAGCQHRLWGRQPRHPAARVPPGRLQDIGNSRFPGSRTHPGEHSTVTAQLSAPGGQGGAGPLAEGREQRSLLPASSSSTSPSADPTLSPPAGSTSLQTAPERLFSQHSCPAPTREVKGASGEKTSWPEPCTLLPAPRLSESCAASVRAGRGRDRQRAGSSHLREDFITQS